MLSHHIISGGMFNGKTNKPILIFDPSACIKPNTKQPYFLFLFVREAEAQTAALSVDRDVDAENKRW